MRPSLRHLLAGALALLAAIATPNAGAAQKKIDAIATFTVLGDIVQQVGGDRVEVTSLIGVDQDAHHFEPTPQDAQKVKEADIVFLHGGAGFEGYLPRLVAASGFAGPQVVVSKGVAFRTRTRDGKASDDPHTWNNPLNAIVYVNHIVEALSVIDPQGKDYYAARARQYEAQLRELDTHAKELFEKIPPERRKVITSHGAFGYLGAAYGITFLSPLGISTDSAPSAQFISQLIDQIKAEDVKVYFMENSNDPRFVEQIAAATDAKPGGELYAEALSGPQGPAPTYLAMVRHNVETIAAALAASR